MLEMPDDPPWDCRHYLAQGLLPDGRGGLVTLSGGTLAPGNSVGILAVSSLITSLARPPSSSPAAAG